jgi:hypothetical protein
MQAAPTEPQAAAPPAAGLGEESRSYELTGFHPFQTFKTFQSLAEGGRKLDGYFFFLWLAHPALMIRVVSSSFLLLSVYAISRTPFELLLANRKRRRSISE